MLGAIPSLPHTPSWRGAQLKHRDNFIFKKQCSGNFYIVYRFEAFTAVIFQVEVF
jgi:hypothetical protein